MEWEKVGFKEEPFKTQPIISDTLQLYTGNSEKIKNCQAVLQSNNSVMVIEGARGVGTTSFGNYLRFNALLSKKYFTPISEIRVEPRWNADTLMAAIIANIVSTLELQYFDSVKDNPGFKEAKAMVQHVTKTFRSFGASAFGFGANYGESGSVTQPMIVPTQVLSHHLENLSKVVQTIGFKYGLLIQLNNLDIGVVQEEQHLKNLLNIMRDYFQITGTSWFLVGDESLRRFIAQNVDRVDDIIIYETLITPLSESEYLSMIEKRIEYFRLNTKTILPVDKEVLVFLYKITNGRLRYIFGLIQRLFNVLQVGTLLDKITLEIAKPVVTQYARDRVRKFHLSNNEEIVLKTIVSHKSLQVKEIAEILGKKVNYISTILSQLQEYQLVHYIKQWRSHHYSPSVDASIAYSD